MDSFSLNHPMEGFVSLRSSSRSLGYLRFTGRLDGAEVTCLWSPQEPALPCAAVLAFPVLSSGQGWIHHPSLLPQVFPVGRALPSQAFPLGCQAVPVCRLPEEVCPQRPLSQTREDPPGPALRPAGAAGRQQKLSLAARPCKAESRRPQSQANRMQNPL